MVDKQIEKYLPKLRFPEFKNDGEWEVKKLCEIAEKRTERNRGNLPLPVLTNSATEGVLNQANYFEREIVTKDNLTNYYIVDKNDFVYNPRISSTAPVGPISRNKAERGIMSPLYTVFRFNKGDLDFFEQYFRTNYWHQYIKKKANFGARFDRINIAAEDFFNLPVPFPSDPEQTQIATALCSLDSLIQSCKEKLEQFKAHKKGLMQKLFPSLGKAIPVHRFPEFKDCGDWRCVKLKEIIKVNSGRDYKHLKPGSIPVYGTGGYMTSVNEMLSSVDAVGIGRKGTIDKPQYLCAPFWTVDTLFFLTSLGEIDILFFYYLTQLIPWKKYGEQTGVPSLSKVSIEDLEICIPCELEQRKIASVLFSSDELIKKEEDRISFLSSYKQGLLHELLL